jgi:ferredoxin
MNAPSVNEAEVILSLSGLNALLSVLGEEGFEVHGPTVDNGVIAIEPIRSIDDLPAGVTDCQSGGHYRLESREDEARFGYAVGPRSWKHLLHPPRAKVWTLTREHSAPGPDGSVDTTASAGTVAVAINRPPATPRAFIGVRPCELAAIAKQDRVLAEGPHPDPVYQAARHDNIVVAVNCGDPSDSCFCVSMGTGPAAGDGYDLALTELVDGGTSRFLTHVGSERGARLLALVGARSGGESRHHLDTAGDADRDEARQVVQAAASIMSERFGPRLDNHDTAELLYENLESDQWSSIAQRCLSCGNCTLACPTCFCTDLEDVTDLSGAVTDRWRVWDNCFSLSFSLMGPGPVRADTESRYRQWLVHKLGSWHDQFGESGCVGCGRCITWCPVGIDLREEMVTMAGGGEFR